MIKLRKWQFFDKYGLAKSLNHKKVQDNLRCGMPYPYTPDDVKRYISDMWNANFNDVIAFAINLDGKAIGSISVFREQNIHARTGELGYYIGKPYREHKYITKAVKNGEVPDMKMYALTKKG